MPDYDAVIVGGSLAGCAAATLLARQGARVAVLERSPRPDAYKTVCTHFIQASATPVLERLGLVEEIEAAGGVRNGGEIWTRWGWVRPRPEPGGELPYGYDIRRQKLDPMVRALARRTPGVDYHAGASVTGLLRDATGRPGGVRVTSRDGGERETTARVVVGADGRDSRVARMAGAPGRVRPHNRFAYFAYYRDLPLPTGNLSQLWLLDPDVAYAFPNDDGLTLLAAMPHRDRLPAFKADLEGAFERYFAGLPDAPPLERAERVSPVLGKLEMPNVSRPAARRGVAFVGDAALATDPVWGVGCGFALQSAEWLADHLGGPLATGGDVDAALERYRRTHRRRLAGHHFLIADYASGRRFSPVERLLFRAAARDPWAARQLHAFGNRMIGPGRLFTPRTLARMALAARPGRVHAAA